MSSIDPKVLTDHLTSFGWTPLPGGPALASKSYATAVGPKEGHVYLADYGPGSESLALQGEYHSEGRNVLEASGLLLPRNASAETLAQLVAQFAERCDAVVAETYAVRLLR